MTHQQCPLCREDIAPDAIACSHCGTQLARSRTVMMIDAVSAVTRDFRVSIGPVPSCTAWCVWRHQGNKQGLQQCLDDCKAASAVADVAERMHRDLARTFIEVIWSKGNIDPVPELAKSVIKQFSSHALTLLK